MVTGRQDDEAEKMTVEQMIAMKAGTSFFKVYQSRRGIDTHLRSDIHRYLMFVGSVCFLFGFIESRSITLDS